MTEVPVSRHYFHKRSENYVNNENAYYKKSLTAFLHPEENIMVNPCQGVGPGKSGSTYLQFPKAIIVIMGEKAKAKKTEHLEL